MVHLMFQLEIKSDLNPRTDGLYYVVGGGGSLYALGQRILSYYRATIWKIGWGNSGFWTQSLRIVCLPNFRPVGIKPNELEVDAEWWIESVAFIEQQQKESLRQSVRGKGIPMCEPHVDKKQTKTNEDSEKLDKILNMIQQMVSSKRKWSSEEDDPTRPANDHDEEEAKEYRNENIVCKLF
ncbi:hypothetical protein L1987_21294 [Smallanthus sonchifolius]|uniref:Uncharacterized protein n=1 Tax=Smallanthus sonchifolius TaxID=185202 RepID=A0ACB9ITH4_9ASTR|nr:hypothetical protein L1987_21294 [Smallanthus sonchifolius]